MRNWGSVWRGIRAMRPGSGPVIYGVWRYGRPGWGVSQRGRFWVHLWTPSWHAGRGPYISIGLGIIAVGRGYSP